MFELKKVFETQVGNGDMAQDVRLEIFQSVSEPQKFRARAYVLDSFRLTPSFQDERERPIQQCDDDLLAERSWLWLDKTMEVFEADTLEDAARAVLREFDLASRGELWKDCD